MTTPTPDEKPPSESAPEAPTRDEITVTTDSDEQATSAAVEKHELETTSHVVTSDALPAESKEAAPAEGSEDDADAKAASSKASDDADSGTDDKAAAEKVAADKAKASDATAGEDAATEGKPSGEESEPEPEKLGRRARKMKRLQAKIDAQDAQITALQAQAKQTDDKPPEKPEPDDFASWEEYADKLADWKVAQKAAEAAPAADRAEAADAALPESWGEVQDKYDDFDEVAFNDDLKVSAAMADALTAMEADGAELLYQLGKHPEDAKRIAKVRGEVAVARELGKFEASVAAEIPGKPPQKTNGKQPGAGQAADAPKVSSAPKPITRTEGGTGGSADKDPSNMTPAEYRQWREGSRPPG